MTERIVAAAIFVDGVVYSLPAPKRHHHVIWYLVDNNLTELPVGGEQGFVTSTGRFVERDEAARLAVASGQVAQADLRYDDMLFSEDVW